MPANIYYDNTASSASAAVWCEWNGTSAATSTGSCMWRIWTTTAASTATVTASTTAWKGWCDASDAVYVKVRQPTREELAAQAEQAEARRMAAEARLAVETKERKAAEQRAKKLLLQNLNLEQKLEYNRRKAFKVRTPSGTLYELRHGWAGNVEELNGKGKPVNRFCIHPREAVPVADSLLAQKLLLENDEIEFRRIANRTPMLAN